MRKKIQFFVCLFGISSILISGDQQSDEIIKLNVGGRIFETYRTTLTSFTESMLGVMFSMDSKFRLPKKTQDGYIFLDENPDYFAYILDYMRYGNFNNVDIEIAKNIRPLAQKICYPMCEIIDEFIAKESYKVKLMRVYEEQRDHWYLSRVDNGMIIGRHWFYNQFEGQPYWIEHLYRNVNKDLCFSIEYKKPCIFNLNNNKKIGENFVEYSIPEPNPIEHAIKINDLDYYVCSAAINNKFAIFNANTGKKINLKEEYETLLECIDALNRYVKEKILPENKQ